MTEDGLFFSSLKDAESLYTKQPRWEAPKLANAPSHAEEITMIKRLRDAILNVEGLADNRNNRLKRFMDLSYDGPAIEYVAHKTLRTSWIIKLCARLVTTAQDMLVTLHQKGWRIPILDPTRLSESKYEKGLDFTQRFESIEYLLKVSEEHCGQHERHDSIISISIARRAARPY